MGHWPKCACIFNCSIGIHLLIGSCLREYLTRIADKREIRVLYRGKMDAEDEDEDDRSNAPTPSIMTYLKHVANPTFPLDRIPIQWTSTEHSKILREDRDGRIITTSGEGGGRLCIECKACGKRMPTIHGNIRPGRPHTQYVPRFWYAHKLHCSTLQ